MKLKKYLIYRKNKKLGIIRDGYYRLIAFSIIVLLSIAVKNYAILLFIFMTIAINTSYLLEYLYKFAGYNLERIIWAYSLQEAEIKSFKIFDQKINSEQEVV